MRTEGNFLSEVDSVRFEFLWRVSPCVVQNRTAVEGGTVRGKFCTMQVPAGETPIKRETEKHLVKSEETP